MNSQEDLKSLYSKLVDSLNCCICQDVLKDARDLSCGHTYCLGCIQELVGIRGWKKTIQCPQCKKETAIPSGSLKALKQNYKLNCIIEEQGMMIKKLGNAASAEKVAVARSEVEEPEVQIFVRDLESKSQSIMIRPSDTVAELKKKAERKTGIPAEEQFLTFQSKTLDAKQTMRDLGVQVHSLVVMALRGHGGCF